MLNRLLATLAILAIAMSAQAYPTYESGIRDAAMYHKFTFIAGDTQDSRSIESCGSMTITANIAGSDAFSVYQIDNPASAAATGSLIVAYTSDPTSVTSVKPTKDWIRIDAVTNTTGGSTVTIRCSNIDLSDAGVGGGGGALDDVITAADCSANATTLTPATGTHLVSGASCIAADSIVIPDLSAFDSDAGLVLTVVNETSNYMIVDASANTGGVVIEGGSETVPAGATFSVIQTAASTVQVIGTGVGIVNLEDGINNIESALDPRDVDGNGIYNEASDQIACAGQCTYFSTSGKRWEYNAVSGEWECGTCLRYLDPGLSRPMGPGVETVSTDCIEIWTSGYSGSTGMDATDTGDCTYSGNLLNNFSQQRDETSDLSSPSGTYVLESFCAISAFADTAVRGAIYHLTDDDNVTDLASVALPTDQADALDGFIRGDTRCDDTTGLPARIDNNQTLSVTVEDGGTNCINGTGCVADVVTAYLRVIVMKLD